MEDDKKAIEEFEREFESTDFEDAEDVQGTVKVSFNGITFIDIDKRDRDDWPFYDYECTRIPHKGEVINFRHIVGNDTNYYFGEVLLVIDERQLWGEDKMQDCEVKTQSITVLMREITGPLGNETYNTLLNGVSK